MNQSIDPLPTIFLPSVRNGKKVKPFPIMQFHLGFSENLFVPWVQETLVGRASQGSLDLVLPMNNIFACYGTLYSDRSIRNIDVLTAALAGTLYD